VVGGVQKAHKVSVSQRVLLFKYLIFQHIL
jgi:hypothetical protein